MATYRSYKKINGSILPDSFITSSMISNNAFATWNVKWFFGEPCACSTGCCCLWQVPTGVSRMYIEMWGGGGGGHGSCNCSRCQNYIGAQGGYYNAKMIDTTPGCQYTVCAGGNSNCCRLECTGCYGCTSFVNGYNLSNFCAIGGAPGCAIGSWDMTCFSEFPCCLGPGANGGDFGMGNHAGGSWRPLGVFCHCHGKWAYPTAAPFIGTNVRQVLHSCWIRCGCWTVPYGHGGQGAMTNVCGSSCCGQGGMGGPGLVKISYV
jgi:hypothetical protein